MDARRKRLQRTLVWRAAALSPVRCIVADPGWKFGDALPGKSRGAAKNYKCMTVEELIAWRATWPFKVAKDAYLIMWRVSSMQREALEVARGWGFSDPKVEIVWAKRTKNDKPFFGLGRTLRAAHETALVCTVGSPKPLNLSTRTLFEAGTLDDLSFEDVVRAHSQKPERFYEVVEKTFPSPRVELFARMHRGMFDLQIGDELGKLDA